MSCLDKLAIQGIRSFGPEEPRIIQFYSPLTLIKGQNGCGKTTIIESLKFVTTGEVPHGPSGKQAFVHDPKISREKSVRGQIKLRFKSTNNQFVTGARIVEVTQKLKKLEFSSVDSVLEYDTPAGKKNISGKCIDFHTEMTSLLGVGKPILENVIFCHQEDANWPLDEDKKVKDKFDAIFNATKYIKCLDAIRKLHKDKKAEVKGIGLSLDSLKGLKEQSDRLKRDLKGVEKSHENLKEEQVTLVTNEGPIRKRLKEINAIEETIYDINGNINGKEHQLRSIREMQTELRSSQSEKYTCSNMELASMIRDFERNTKGQESKQKELEVCLQKVNRKISALKKDESEALLLMGNLEAAQKNHFDDIKKRNMLLEALVSKYNIANYEGCDSFDENESKIILSRASDYLKEEKEEMLQKRKDFENKEAKLQNEMDSLRSEEVTLEHKIESLSKENETASQRMRELQRILLQNEDELSSTNLEELKSSIEEIARKITREKENVNVTQLELETEEKREEKEKVEKELEELKRKVAKMNKQAEARSQFDIHMKDKKALEQRNQFLKQKNKEDFNNIFGCEVGDNVRHVLDAHSSNFRKLITSEREKKSKLDRTKTELTMKIENEKAALANLETQIKGFESKLEDLCGSSNLESAIDRSKEIIDLLLKTKGDHESSRVLFRGFMDKIRAGEACPLCYRDFDEGYEKDMLIEDLEKKLDRLPDELDRLKRDLKVKESLHEKLLQLRPQKEQADKSAKELDTRRSNLKKLYTELEKTSVDLEASGKQLSSLLSKEELCVKIQPDVVTMDSNVRTIRQLGDKISNIQATLGNTDDALSMDELMRLQTSLEQKCKTIQREIDATQQDIMNHNNQLQRLNNRKLELSTKELELKTKQQETEKLKEELETLKKKKITLETNKDDFLEAIAPVKVELKDKIDIKERVIQEKNKFVEAETKRIESLRDDMRQAIDIHKTTLAYIDGRRNEGLVDAKRKVQSLQEESGEKERLKKELQEEINRILKELTAHKERKRNMENENKIRMKETEAVELEKVISELKEEVKVYDYDKISNEKQKLIRDETKIFKNKANLEGRLEELKRKKTDIQGNLNNPRIKNAEKNYMDTVINMKCTDIACNDLSTYSKALETAVLRYHREKMSNINKIIRELWRNTYKGNDIDYIEIKTDESGLQGADKRRSYNYRVVMVKKNVEMDMRGRCSAGQKVLTSLIIRMALAETFSASCGVLALDEPTTNLDRENIDALAAALLSIVNKRSSQKNFQLIVITHDEDFVDCLLRAECVEQYYEVSRDKGGLSVIETMDLRK